MSTPTLTGSDVETLGVLSDRGSVVSSVRSSSLRARSITDARDIAANMVSIRAGSSCVDCGIDPIADHIEYYDQAVKDGVELELNFVEASDSYWIAQSHAIACRVYTIQESITKHWDDCQNAHTRAIMKITYDDGLSRSYVNTGISCNTLLNRAASVMNSTRASSTRSVTRNYRRFRADTTQRAGSYLGTYVNHSSISYITHHLMKYHNSRQYMYHQHWGEMSNATYHAGRQQPDGLFQLLANAQGLYADIAAGNAKAQTQQSSGGSNAWQAIGTIVQIAALVMS